MTYPSGKSIWDLLNIGPTSDERSIRRAYALALREIDPHQSPEDFMALRAAYEAALQHARLFATLQLDPLESDRVGSNPQGSDEEDADYLASQPESEPERFATEAPSHGSGIDAKLYGDESTKPSPTDSKAEGQSSNAEPSADARVKELAIDRFDGFVSAVFRQSPDDPEGYRGLLQEYCRADDAFELRRMFVEQFAHNLATRAFGLHSGALLVAARAFFGWDDLREIRNFSFPAVPKLSDLLDELSLLNAPELQFYLRLCLAPNEALAAKLWRFNENFGTRTPLLTQFFYGKGHLEAWRQLFAMPQVRLRVAMRRTWTVSIFTARWLFQHYAYRAAATAVLLAVCIVSFDALTTWSKFRQRPGCDAAYAHAIRSKWRDMPIEQVGKMDLCAQASVLPARCEDRRSLDRLNAILERANLLAFENHLVLDLWDGRPIAFAKDATCVHKWIYVQRDLWAAFDIQTAKGMLAEMRDCEPSPDMRTKPIVRLLPFVEGWGGADPEDSPARIPLSSIVRGLQDELPRPAYHSGTNYGALCLSQAEEERLLVERPLEKAAIEAVSR